MKVGRLGGAGVIAVQQLVRGEMGTGRSMVGTHAEVERGKSGAVYTAPQTTLGQDYRTERKEARNRTKCLWTSPGRRHL